MLRKGNNFGIVGSPSKLTVAVKFIRVLYEFRKRFSVDARLNLLNVPFTLTSTDSVRRIGFRTTSCAK